MMFPCRLPLSFTTEVVPPDSEASVQTRMRIIYSDRARGISESAALRVLCSTARCRRRPNEPVDLAEIANRFHVPAVNSIHETIRPANDSHKPLPVFGKSNRKRNSAASSLRQDIYKLSNICARWLSSKRSVHL